MADDANDSMVNDFFSDANGLIDQDSGELLPSSSNQNQFQSQQQNNGDQLPNQNQQNNNGIDPKNQNGQQQNFNQQSQQQNGNNQQPQQTFDKQFFKADEKGNQVFDANQALSFLTSQNNGFQYQGISTPLQKQPQQPNAQSQQQPQQEKPAWQIELEEEDRIRNESRSKHTVWRNYLQEALENGYSGDSAIAYADRKAEEESDKDYRKSLFEFKSKIAEEATKKQQEEIELQNITPKSKVNLAKAFNELGGEDKFYSLIFGVPTPDGKNLTGGFGIDVINMLFDRDHRGQKLPSDPAQLKDVYDKWYTKLTANENDLRFVMDIAKSRLQMSLFPQLVNHIQSVRDAGNLQMSQASQRTPSGINKQSMGNAKDSLDQYLYGSGGQAQGSYDTI